jgi:hypothetical protein
MIVKPFRIDKQKVKRIFTFGCSFTNFFWPTWAVMVSKELAHAEFYNFGLSGAGNLCISSKIAEANQRFQFCETDLVMVMWSTYLREDRWLHGRWLGAGNVYSTGLYDKEFVENYSDVCGYLIRDCSLISMTKNFLNNLPCQSLMMLSVPLDYLDASIGYREEVYNEIQDLYKPLFFHFPTSLYDFTKKDNDWPATHSYYWNNEKHNDSHPLPTTVCNYLNEYIISLSDHVKEYAEKATQKLLSLDEKSKIVEEFQYETIERRLF